MNDYQALLSKYQSELTQLQIQQSKDQEKIQSLCSLLNLDSSSPSLLDDVLALEQSLLTQQAQYESALQSLISQLDESKS